MVYIIFFLIHSSSIPSFQEFATTQVFVFSDHPVVIDLPCHVNPVLTGLACLVLNPLLTGLLCHVDINIALIGLPCLVDNPVLTGLSCHTVNPVLTGFPHRLLIQY